MGPSVPTYQVRLQWPNQTVAIAVSADETILDAAEAADLGLPFGCRRGACATCTGRVEVGAVRHRRDPVGLKKRHRETGYALLCIATPTQDCEIRVGAGVQAELVPNPWR